MNPSPFSGPAVAGVLLLSGAGFMLSAPGAAQTAQAAPAGAQTASLADPFALGQITVTAPRLGGLVLGENTLGAEAIYLFSRNTLDDAANLLPGVSASNSGGSRNERLIYVRGFDRFQVPLSIDGIRVYLPADNRLDFGRFLTPDVAEVQVAKGYASVLDGPGAMGGAINLVTRQPTKALEAEGRMTLNLDRDLGYGGYTGFALLGTKHDRWYAQASYARNFQDHWDLSGGYHPTATSVEDGGARDFSRSADWRVNAKIGFTPNDTDEYTLSYTRQEGSKNAPLHITDTATQRNWAWPYWNVESLYFLSTTALSDQAVLKARAFYNRFDNLLRSFDDRTQTTQTLGRSFNSYYADDGWGGSLQLAVDLLEQDRFTIATHYRRDKSVEWQETFPGGFVEPKQTDLEEIFSVAAENRLQLTPELAFTSGFSYDWRDLHKAEEYGVPPEGGAARLFSYPLRNASAWNAQGQLQWRRDETSLHLGVSSRARFPSIFERFSSRFGGATSNPDLKAERATNIELGAARRLGGIALEGAVFYSRISDGIVAFPIIFQGQAVTQSRNVGTGDYAGAELAIDGQLTKTIGFGANYTYVHRVLHDPSNPDFRPTGVPAHKGFLWLDWAPVPRLHLVPSIDLASDRWTVNTAGTRYYQTGAYALANLRADYALPNGVVLSVGGRNLFDSNYTLTDGFPEPGRSLFLGVRARY